MINTLTTQIIGFVLLFAPYVWEAMNDENGDFNKRFDIQVRALLMLAVSTLNTLLNELSWKFVIQSLNMTLAIFFMFFDYTIAYLLIKNKVVESPRAKWYTYLSKVKEVDNWKIWNTLKPGARLTVRIVYFVASLIFYFWI